MVYYNHSKGTETLQTAKKRRKTMTSIEIREILTGTFETESDRQYWVDKLAETERKEKNAKETEKYLKDMKVYDR